MATDLRRPLMVCCNGLALLSLSALAVIASAQNLTDPTRLPSELSATQGEDISTGLQSIIISPTRRAAIINGQTVELGGKTGDDRLIEVSEGGVVLQGAKGRQVLTLFPNVIINKKAILPPMADDVKNSDQERKPANKPDRQAGKKEEK